jgi:hypothetical protein
MKKISFKILSIVLFVLIILLIILIYLLERPNVEVTDADKKRIEFVKETALKYGMGNAIETTQDTIKESNKNTDDIVSFGKKQIYELLIGIGDDTESFTLIYHKFESSEAGKKEAVELFDAFKGSIKNAINSSNMNETINTETGDKTFTAKLSENIETATSTEDRNAEKAQDRVNATETSIVLIYDAQKYEVAQLNHQVQSSETIYEMTDKVLMDMGWENESN